MQLALVMILSTKRYDAHLRRLRRQLAEREAAGLAGRCCVIFRQR
jgi:DNA-binding transcriptional MocR family regulator